MMVLVVGAGRVGAAVAKSALAAGHTVSVLDEDPLSHERLDAGQATSWEDAGGRFTVGTAIEIDALLAAGIEEADIFIAATRGDNTNILVAQIAQRRFGVGHVIVRVLDPARSDWYAEQGLHTICAVKLGIAMFEKAIAEVVDHLMYVIVVGGGKVGLNLARELIRNGQEVTLIEANRAAYLRIEQELEHAAQYGDGTELWVLERAGIQRADLVVAVTGDDEDNILICQVAKEKYLCERIIARCNNPRNLQHFKLLGVQPAVSATDLILNLIEHEVPGHGLVHLLDLPDEELEIIEVEVADGRARRRRARRRPAPARGQPHHLRAAARQGGLRAEGRHGHRGRQRGARRARPGPRAADHGPVRAGRTARVGIGAELITGAHAVLYSSDAVALRAFLRDKLGFESVDAGGGWLIFALPPAEIAAHPSSPQDSGRHQLYLMCDDIEATVAELVGEGRRVQRGRSRTSAGAADRDPRARRRRDRALRAAPSEPPR